LPGFACSGCDGATRRARRSAVVCRWRRLSLWKKVATVGLVASVVVVGTAGGVYAAWSQQTPRASGSQSTARLTSTFLNTGTNTWTTAIPVLNPGEYLYRYLAIANPGSVTPAGTGSAEFHPHCGRQR
jgi:hypothetical protein